MQKKTNSFVSSVFSTAENVGRAWLLPLLKQHITNTELAYFMRKLVPLNERLMSKLAEFRNRGRMIEVKVYETLTQQIWALLPGFCDLPYDFPKANIYLLIYLFISCEASH